ncbi:MAG: hypothetical protein F6K48_24015 [Okeania sp. SIO3H1]|nr:hypothetical protein [Okeania sp. SIO3H1]
MTLKIRRKNNTVKSSYLCDSTTATSLAEADNSSSCNGKEVKIAQVKI